MDWETKTERITREEFDLDKLRGVAPESIYEFLVNGVEKAQEQVNSKLYECEFCGVIHQSVYTCKQQLEHKKEADPDSIKEGLTFEDMDILREKVGAEIVLGDLSINQMRQILEGEVQQ